MANTHSTLASLFTDIAKAIRSKTGSSASIVADNFPTAISSIEVKENLDAELSTQDSLIAQINTALVGKAGVALPVLSNPAGAGNIEAGYQAIDGTGKMIEGAMPAGVEHIDLGKITGLQTITIAAKHKNFMLLRHVDSAMNPDPYLGEDGYGGIQYLEVRNGVCVAVCLVYSNALQSRTNEKASAIFTITIGENTTVKVNSGNGTYTFNCESTGYQKYDYFGWD